MNIENMNESGNNQERRPVRHKDNSVKILVPIIVLISMFAGALLFRFFGRIAPIENTSSVFLNTASSSPSIEKLKQVYKLINDRYVDTVNINDMVEKMIPDMLTQLDPHSVYIPKKSVETVNEDLDGSFVGVGVQFNIQQDTVNVVEVITGGPSQQAGIMAGDKIVKVDDSLFVGKMVTNNAVFKKLKGKKGSWVKLSIKRHNIAKLIDFNIKRNDIPVKSVDVAYMMKGDVGYIKVDKFGKNTYPEFLVGLNKLYKGNMKSLVIDLRSNGGGYMETAIQMIDLFLPPDETIVYTEGKSQPKEVYSSSGKGIFTQLPMAVLIDDWSASASEIFSGAMQDNDRAIIVGRRSFGKGLVQQQITLSDQSAVRLTIARYHTPSGRCIQKPYKNDADYSMDIYNRMNHGEFTNIDSIKLDETHKYLTRGGRTVYGGGGIMPDYFVPADTTGVTPYFSAVSNPGYIFQFAYRYVDDNRETLKNIKSVLALQTYLDEQNVLDQFVKFAASNGVKLKVKEFSESKFLIKNRLYAYIARNSQGEEAFYRILEDDDKVIGKAIEEIYKPILK